MDLDPSDEDLAFAVRLGAWLEENADPDWLDRCTGYDDYVAEQNRWERLLTSSGWACRETCGEQAARVRRDAGDEALVEFAIGMWANALTTRRCQRGYTPPQVWDRNGLHALSEHSRFTVASR
ncbi:hypothetical protein ACW2Q0_07695 [Nocardia sp. R16R-3T]